MFRDRQRTSIWRVSIRLLGLALVLGACLPAVAQSGPDPYDPWNAQYRAFVFPTTPTNLALPNQARIGMLSNRSFERDIDMPFQDQNLFGATPNPTGRFVPYYRSRDALRAYQYARPDTSAAANDSLNRVYVPNRGDQFFQEKDAREQRFFEAMRVRDPMRRMELLRELERERASAARPTPSGSSRDRAAAPAERAPAETPVAPAAPAAPPRANRLSDPDRSLMLLDRTREDRSPSAFRTFMDFNKMSTEVKPEEKKESTGPGIFPD